MLTIVGCRQILGLMVMDGSTLSRLGKVEELWLDDQGKVAYLSSIEGYLPWEQVSDIGDRAISTYGRLIVEAPKTLQSLDQREVRSVQGETLGWVKDFLFDWHTGEIVIYVLGGDIEEVVFYPQDVEEFTIEYLKIRQNSWKDLKPKSEGLKDFLSEKSQQVQHLVKTLSDRLHPLISVQDHPEVVQVKIKEVSDEMADSGHHDTKALAEATTYLHERWESLQHTIERARTRAKIALDSAWKHLTKSS